MLKNKGQYLLYVFAATAWIAISAILPDFLDNPITGIKGFFTIAIYIIAISGISFLLLYLASLNKYITAIFIPLYGLVGAAVSYYRTMYRVTVTPLILDCILHTNIEEATGVITWSLVTWTLLNTCIGILFVTWRWRIPSPKMSWVHAICTLLLFIGYYNCNSRLKQSINQRFPMHIIKSSQEHLWLQQQRKKPHALPFYTKIQTIDNLDIVVVIGESARADHLSLNGYDRPTTPLLEKRSNVVSLPNVYSEYTHTLASVPVLLTRADSLHPEYQFSETSFAAILKQENYYCTWISNQDLGQTFATFPTECDTCIWVNAGKSVFVFSGWYDEELLPHIDKQLSLGNSNNLMIIHTIGSHWYYNNHVPQSHNHFLPITDNRVVTNNTTEQVINSYDNSILYLDFILDSIIQRFEKRNAVVIYLSDHGESLGEEGFWLHAAGADVTKNPACIVWYSDSFALRFPNKIDALQHNYLKHYRTDCLFHSVLDIAGIQCPDSTSSEMSIFTTIQ